MIENPGQTARKNAVRDLILGVVFFILLSVVLFSVVFGIPLTGTPKLNEVNTATVSFEGKTVEVTPEDMQIAVDLAGGLKRWVGECDQTMPKAVITYQMKDGTEVVVGADKDTIYKDGKYYAPKGTNGELFQNVVEGIFFGE